VINKNFFSELKILDGGKSAKLIGGCCEIKPTHIKKLLN